MPGFPMDIDRYFKDFVSLLYPEACYGCSHNMVQGEHILCTSCRINLTKTYNYRENNHPLKLRLSGRINFQHVFSFLKFNKSGITQHLLHQLKYKHASEIGILLGRMYGSELAENGFSHSFDSVLPVPLHKSRLKKRGYNQSEVIANGLCEYLQADLLPETLIRTKATTSQTKHSGQKRWQNVKDIFEVKYPQNIEGRHILLVDDVVTTGATIESLASKVAAYNPKSISVLALAEAN